MRLHEFLTARRQKLIDRWVLAIQKRGGGLTRVELVDRMPFFIDDLIRALRVGALPPPDGGIPNAEEHGTQRFGLGFDVGELVREYGVLHTCILDLAEEAGSPLDANDAKVLAAYLSEGTSDAISQYVAQRDAELQRNSAEHLGFIAHELRNPLATAQMAFGVVRQQLEDTHPVLALERALLRLSTMVDNTLTDAWLKVGATLRGERVDLGALLSEIEGDMAGEAERRGVVMKVESEPIMLHADPRLLGSAISNLVRNALKFTHERSRVVIRAWQHESRVLIEVEDECGGLPPGKTEELFSPFVQKGTDRSGFGLGLAIARQAAESHNGTIKVRNIPGKGCAFTIDLPALPS